MSSKAEDTIMKLIMELFKGDAVKFFGIDKRVVSAQRTELTQLQLQKNIDDWVLLAEDDTFIHLEFQTTNRKDDLPRFMVSDAMLHYKERKPIQTIVVYSCGITDTMTTLDAGAIHYSVNAFYMAKLDGDSAYDTLQAKIATNAALTKQDLMSIVFLPLMHGTVDKVKRIEQSIELSKRIPATEEQMQIQAMLDLLAEKFLNREQLKRVKELLSMTAVAEMIAEDKAIEIAREMLRDNLALTAIKKYTGLDDATIAQLKTEIENE